MNFDAIEAVRNVLIGNGALTALVPAAQIIAARGTLPVTYPAITLSEDLIEDGNDFNMEGLFYIRIYTQDAKKDRALSAIHKAVFPLVGRNGAALNITDSDVTFHEFRQVFGTQAVHEPEVDVDTWSLTTHYMCKVTI